VWELFTHREGISTLHARHKGRQPLIECAQRDFRIIYFSLFIFFWVKNVEAKLHGESKVIQRCFDDNNDDDKGDDKKLKD